MAYIDKLRAKEHLETDILKLIRKFQTITGYKVTDITAEKARYQPCDGTVIESISKVTVTIKPQ